MKNKLIIFLVVILITGGSLAIFLSTRLKNNKMNQQTMNEKNIEVELPQPDKDSDFSVEKAIFQRRSHRQFTDQSLNLNQVSQLLWAAQGITDGQAGFRSVPSAGALYPLEIYLLVGQNKVENLDAGFYHYQPEPHLISQTRTDDLRNELSRVSLGQESINQAPISIIITGVFERTQAKYSDRGERYVYMEAGHAGQNIYLQSESLGLGTVVIGAFNDESLIELLQTPKNHQPLYVIPIGYPQ